jgi:predicted Zn-dependent protease
VSPANRELARAAFERAFALDPDLASAHQFYTSTEVDAGQAERAIARLLARLKRHPGDADSLAGLVQAFRFCGLLEESLEAHRRAVEVDPAAATGVAYTLFMSGDYAAAIEAYSGRGAYYLDAAAWAALGERQRAATLLRKRLGRPALSPLITALMSSLLAVLERRNGDAARIMDGADRSHDPEVVFYFARHYAESGRADAALELLRQAARAGFVCAPATLRRDPWFKSLRRRRAFAPLLKDLQARVRRARAQLRFP